jgi:tetratricopeptide (TPR) repeat protein
VKERLRSLGYIASGPAPARDRYTAADDPKRLIDLDRRMHLAVEAYQAGHLGEAASILEQVVAERPDNAGAHLDLAVAYWQDGEQAKAIQTLQDAMAHGADGLDVRAELGLCLALSGEGARAIRLLEGSAADDPDALNALGLAYAQANRPADALRTFHHMLEVDPGSGLAYENMAAVHLAGKDYRAAEAALRRSLELDARLTGARTMLGTVLAAEGRRGEAIETWKQAAERDAEAYDALYDLTGALVEAGRSDEARTYGERFLTSAPPAGYSRQIAQVRQLLTGRR